MICGVSDHARERMVERYGRDLTAAEWRSVVLSILDGHAALLSRDGRSERYLVTVLGGEPLRIVWSPEAAIVLTVLDPSQSTTCAVAHHRAAKIKASLSIPAHFARGERRRPLTIWNARPA